MLKLFGSCFLTRRRSMIPMKKWSASWSNWKRVKRMSEKTIFLPLTSSNIVNNSSKIRNLPHHQIPNTRLVKPKQGANFRPWSSGLSSSVSGRTWKRSRTSSWRTLECALKTWLKQTSRLLKSLCSAFPTVPTGKSRTSTTILEGSFSGTRYIEFGICKQGGTWKSRTRT